MGIGREVELKQSSGQRDGPQSVGRRLKYLTESQVDFGGKSCIACIPWSVYTLSYLCLPSLSLSRSSSLASTVTSDDVRGIYCLPKAPRQTQERQRRREDDEDDDKCGRFCDIDRKQKQTNCRCAVAYVNKK